MPNNCVPNVKLVGLNLIAGPVTVPVPERAMVCGLPAALSVIVTVAVRVPKSVGVNVTLNTELLCGDTVNGAVGPAIVNSAAFGPVIVTEETSRLPLPVLLMMMGFAVDAVLRLVAGKASEVVLKLTLAPED